MGPSRRSRLAGCTWDGAMALSSAQISRRAISARRAWLGRTPVRRPTARRAGFKAFHLGSFSNRLGSRAVNIILVRPFAARGFRARDSQPTGPDGTLSGSPNPRHAGVRACPPRSGGLAQVIPRYLARRSRLWRRRPHGRRAAPPPPDRSLQIIIDAERLAALFPPPYVVIWPAGLQ